MATDAERNRGAGAYSTPGVDHPATPGGEFKTEGFGPQVSFKITDVNFPSAVYIGRDDRLIVEIAPSAANAPILSGRILRVNPFTGIGDVFYMFEQLPALNPNRVFQAFVFNPGEGFLLNVCLTPNASAIHRGQEYVAVSLIRGTAASFFRVATLIGDYLCTGGNLAWPGSRVLCCSEFPGNLRVVQITNPAAGADWVATVPTGARWKVYSFHALFTASATVANRQVEVIVDDGANIYWDSDAQVNITAGQAVSINDTGTNVPQGVFTTTQNLVIPPQLQMAAGHRIRTATAGIQAGDQWSAINLLVEEVIEE